MAARPPRSKARSDPRVVGVPSRCTAPGTEGPGASTFDGCPRSRTTTLSALVWSDRLGAASPSHSSASPAWAEPLMPSRGLVSDGNFPQPLRGCQDGHPEASAGGSLSAPGPSSRGTPGVGTGLSGLDPVLTHLMRVPRDTPMRGSRNPQYAGHCDGRRNLPDVFADLEGRPAGSVRDGAASPR